jgi:hypothetical protein
MVLEHCSSARPSLQLFDEDIRLEGVISRVLVSWIMCTGGACRPFLHDRHFDAASSFQIGSALVWCSLAPMIWPP